jgi:hypothetical protein
MLTDQSVHPEAGQPPFNFGPWSWREPSRGEHFRRCSFCGSVNPDDLAAEVEWHAQWADRKYGWPHKFYVDIPNHQPGRLYVTSASNSDEPSGMYPLMVPRAELTPEQAAAVERDGDNGPYSSAKFFGFGHRPMHFGKFYTVHLRDADLDPAVKRRIEQGCGLAFTFEGSRVAWRPV